MYVSVICRLVYISLGGQKRTLDALGLEFTVWVLEIELKSSRRAVNALNC